MRIAEPCHYVIRIDGETKICSRPKGHDGKHDFLILSFNLKACDKVRSQVVRESTRQGREQRPLPPDFTSELDAYP